RTIPTVSSAVRPARPPMSPLSLHDALPICLAIEPAAHGEVAGAHGELSREQGRVGGVADGDEQAGHRERLCCASGERAQAHAAQDRKSTRLNSSHVSISYAVFCLKKNIEKP